MTPFVQEQYCTGKHVFFFLFFLIFMSVFLQLGTRLRFHRGPNVEWQEADELGDSDDDSDDDSMVPSSSSIKV